MRAKCHKDTQVRNVTKQLHLHKAYVIYTQHAQYSEPLQYCSESVSKWKDQRLFDFVYWCSLEWITRRAVYVKMRNTEC